jgi:hypothetical protein
VRALIAVLIALIAATASAQEIRRALPVVVKAQAADKWRSLPHETTWQWLVRTGMCTTGLCEGGHGGMAYMNWGDAHAPVYDNVEIEPHEVLLAPYPFTEPAPSNPLYNAQAEREIKTRMRSGVHDTGTARVYRLGVFVGYLRMERVQPTGITI